MVSKYIIAELDKKVNGGKTTNLDTALRKVQQYIIDKIDRTFPEQEFEAWLNSDDDKPFKWNGNSYHWN